MSLELAIAVISLVISIASTVIAYLSFRRTATYERFEYTPRIDVLDEIIEVRETVGGKHYTTRVGNGADAAGNDPPKEGPDGFRYASALTNMGTKTIPVFRVHLDYGARLDDSRRVKFVLCDKFYLGTGASKRVEFSLSKDEIRATMTKFEVLQCAFWLRVTLDTPSGERIEKRRELGRFEVDQFVWSVPPGDTIV